MLEECMPEKNVWGEVSDRSKMRIKRYFRPQLLDVGEGDLLIAYTDLDCQYEFSAGLFNLSQNRDFVRVLGA